MAAAGPSPYNANRLDGAFTVSASSERLDPPRSGARTHADGLVQALAQVVQTYTVLGGVASRQGPVGNECAVRRPARLVGEVVVHAVAEREQGEAVEEGIESVTEGVGGAADVPAQASRAGPGQNHTGVPALAEDVRQPVCSPDGHEVHNAAAFDQDHLLTEQVRPDVRHVWLGEQQHRAELDIGAAVRELRGHRRDRLAGVSDGGRDVAELRCRAPGRQRQGMHRQVEVRQPVRPGLEQAGERKDLAWHVG